MNIISRESNDEKLSKPLETLCVTELEAIEKDKPILMAIVEDIWIDDLIKLSKMVGEGRISEGNARHHVLPVIRGQYLSNKNIIRGLHVQNTKG